MLSRRDQVFVMKVGRLKRVEQREVAALPLVEAPHFRDRCAVTRAHELDPAVRAAFEDLQSPKRRLRAALVEPRQELLEMRFDGERARLVDELKFRRGPCAGDGASAAV